MQNVLLFGALGLGEGALIASLALAVVVFYRGSGVINLSTGAIAMVAGFLFYCFGNGRFGFSTAWPISLVLTLACVTVLGTAVEALVFRPLRNSSPLAKLAASLGLMLVAQTVLSLIFGSSSLSPKSILPSGTVHLLGAVIPLDRFLLTGFVIALAAIL